MKNFYEPTAKNNSAKLLVAILTIIGVACYLVTLFVPLYRGLLVLFCVLFLVAAIFVAYKYLLTSYVYSIFAQGQTPPCLLVEQKQGKRSSLVLRVPLSAVLSLEPYDGRAYPAKCYVFTATMRGGAYQILHAREGGREFCVKLEADETFLATLRTAIFEKKSAAD